jgi:hypothetical protein
VFRTVAWIRVGQLEDAAGTKAASHDRWRQLVKHPRAESLEKRLLAERARLRDELMVQHDVFEPSDDYGPVAVAFAEIAEIERALLALHAEPYGR